MARRTDAIRKLRSKPRVTQPHVAFAQLELQHHVATRLRISGLETTQVSRRDFRGVCEFLLRLPARGSPAPEGSAEGIFHALNVLHDLTGHGERARRATLFRVRTQALNSQVTSCVSRVFC